MGNWSRAPGAQRLSGMYHFGSFPPTLPTYLPYLPSAEPAVDGLFLAETPLKLDSGFPRRPLARPTCEGEANVRGITCSRFLQLPDAPAGIPAPLTAPLNRRRASRYGDWMQREET
ncbi:hypothetical protein BN1723_013042 [Verticillium longisporum]|uniref:Uncharacterized protein n=1 Tax=Verticillium longisporum TaxID=100787 RepID=A0A0G4LNI6_VERLO|nr:hypothetical protein BN1723_013042 [Verticillium longisporum]